MSDKAYREELTRLKLDTPRLNTAYTKIRETVYNLDTVHTNLSDRHEGSERVTFQSKKLLKAARELEETIKSSREYNARRIRELTDLVGDNSLATKMGGDL